MERPHSITVFGILHIVFAVLGVFSLVGSAAMLSMRVGANNPVVKIMRENPGYSAWIKVTIPIGLVSCSALLASGIGLPRLRTWARNLAIAYSIFALLFGLLGTVVNYLFLVRPMLDEVQRSQGPEAAGAIGGALSASIGGCVGLIYPIVLLYFMTRREVAAAFRRPAPPPVPR